MIHYMSSQYAHPVSIEQMCGSLGYNRAYLSRVFKQETGLSPVTYLLKLRIEKSSQLLRERPELSVEQVAASVGLTDALYFSRQFKRFCGQSPSGLPHRHRQSRRQNYALTVLRTSRKRIGCLQKLTGLNNSPFLFKEDGLLSEFCLSESCL
jgi:AraC-like DNA-binding protein